MLRYHGLESHQSANASPPTFSLRLLIANDCPNTTAASLAEALVHFPNLVFIDLSNTLAARDHAVLSKLGDLPDLQVLKLRHTNLRDDDIEVLAQSIGTRVRSLDLSDNKITDKSVRTLLNHCFDSSHGLPVAENTPVRPGSSLAEGDWPSSLSRPDSHLADQFRREDLDDQFVKQLTNNLASRLPSEDLPDSGITHLSIEDNFLTVEGAASLLKSGKLHLFDIGFVDTAKAIGSPRNPPSSLNIKGDSISLPSLSKLIPFLEGLASKNLTYLRIHHTVVTEKAPLIEENVHPAELNTDGNTRCEVDAADKEYEIDGQESAPRYELAGDSVHIVVSPAIGEKPIQSPEGSRYSEVRRGSAFAPEVAQKEEEDEEVVLTATGLGNSAQAINGLNPPISNTTTSSVHNQSPLAAQTHGPSEMSIKMIEAQRRDLRSRKEKELRGLLPGNLPNLCTLVLTGVPYTSTDDHITEALKGFIRDCAEEAQLASQQATREQASLYFQGRPRSMYRQHRARQLFALRSIVLEMDGAPYAPRSRTPFSPMTPPTPTFPHRRTMSSTEDADSEVFLSASANDFSFFDEEECGLPASERSLHFPISALAEKVALPTGDLPSKELPTLQKPRSGEGSSRKIDTIQELSNFRKQRKAAFESASVVGNADMKRHWKGEVNVRHPGSMAVRPGGLDYYGNYFMKGVYR